MRITRSHRLIEKWGTLRFLCWNLTQALPNNLQLECLPSTHLPAPGVQNHHLGLTPQAGHRQVAANPAKCSTLHSQGLQQCRSQTPGFVMGLLLKHYLPTPRERYEQLHLTFISFMHKMTKPQGAGASRYTLDSPETKMSDPIQQINSLCVQKPGRNYILNNDWYYYYYRVPHCHYEQYKITSTLNWPRTVIIIQIHSLEPLRQVHLVSTEYFPLFSRPWLRRSADSPLPLCTPTRRINTTYVIPGVDASDVCYRNILSFIFSHL